MDFITPKIVCLPSFLRSDSNRKSRGKKKWIEKFYEREKIFMQLSECSSESENNEMQIFAIWKWKNAKVISFNFL